MRLAAATVRAPCRPAPPERDRGGGGGGGDWTVLTTAGDRITAHLIEGRLEEEGVEVVLDTSNPAPGAWLYPFGDPRAPVRIYVRRRDFERASLLLHEIGHRVADSAGAGNDRTLIWAMVGILAMIALIEVLDVARCFLAGTC